MLNQDVRSTHKEGTASDAMHPKIGQCDIARAIDGQSVIGIVTSLRANTTFALEVHMHDRYVIGRSSIIHTNQGVGIIGLRNLKAKVLIPIVRGASPSDAIKHPI